MATGNQNSGTLLAAALVAAALCAEGLAAEPAAKPKRARPPNWSADVLDAFFENANEKVEGERPDYTAGQSTVARSNAGAVTNGLGAAESSGTAWSKLIDTETIEAEIKRLAQAVASDVTSASEFKGGKYKDCRRHFSVLAVLFAVSAEYDGDVRWKDTAAGMRNLFARAGRNCKVGTDQTYREATVLKQDLADLVGGSRPQVPQAERAADWAQVTDRPPLMQRLNIAHQDRLTPWLADERQFVDHHDDVRHEAQMAALIADVIGREGFDYWDDAQYAQYARELREGAAELTAATERGNFQQARTAAARMTKACTDCHDGYRE